MTSFPVPRLRAVTRPLPAPPDLLSIADPMSPLAWLRGDRGLVGVGEALRLSFHGPDRLRRAAEVWREIAGAAEVDDPVGQPGSGLVALGTFAFAAESATESLLIVPSTIVVRHGDRGFITRVHTARVGDGAGRGNEPTPTPGGDQAGEPRLPPARPLGQWNGARLAADRRDEPAAAYLRGVAEASQRLERGELEKIVLARQVHAGLSLGDDLRVPLSRLAERYGDCWTFAIDGLLGASPETLVRSMSGSVSARVLAGTRSRCPGNSTDDGRARDELLRSPKDQHEHAFAVQSVVTALSPHVRELRTSEEPFALALPNVWHLATDLTATPGDDSSALELVAALHPTAAVAGTPTDAAIAAIAAIEPFDRGRYAGATGWIDSEGRGEWVIALRCAQLSAGPAARRLTATAGGGIVAGSDAEREFAETEAKFRPVAEAFSRS